MLCTRIPPDTGIGHIIGSLTQIIGMGQNNNLNTQQSGTTKLTCYSII